MQNVQNTFLPSTFIPPPHSFCGDHQRIVYKKGEILDFDIGIAHV